MTSPRVPDLVSPITDRSLPDRVPADEARAAGRYGHDKPTIDNSVVLLIDHQIALLASTRDITNAAQLKSSIVGLARVTKALGLPVLITSSNAQWQIGDTLPEIKELFPDVAIIRLRLRAGELLEQRGDTDRSRPVRLITIRRVSPGLCRR